MYLRRAGVCNQVWHLGVCCCRLRPWWLGVPWDTCRCPSPDAGSLTATATGCRRASSCCSGVGRWPLTRPRQAELAAKDVLQLLQEVCLAGRIACQHTQQRCIRVWTPLISR